MPIKIGNKNTLVPTIPQNPDNPDQAEIFADQGYTNANEVGLETSGLKITDGSKIIGKGGSKIKVIEGITPDFNKPPINVGKENVPVAFPGQVVAFANDPGVVKRQTSWSTEDMKNMAMAKTKNARAKIAPSMNR
jgi:hypothetical protein